MSEEEKFYVKPSGHKRTELTITKLLEHGTSRFPTAEIVPYPPRAGIERYTVKDLYERTQRLANVLEDVGVKKEMRVGVADETSIPFFEAGYAVPCMGAVLHPINVRLSEADFRYVINHAEDEIIITSWHQVPRLEKAKKDGALKRVKHFLISTNDGKPIDTKLEPASFYEKSLKSASRSYNFPDLKEETPCVILHTTGTTGVPKGCWFMHRNITLTSVFAMMAAAPLLGVMQVVLDVVPFYHIMGWGFPYSFMLIGGKFCWAGPPAPEYQLKLIEREKVTTLLGVPTLVYMMLRHPDFEEYDLSSLRFLTMGGAPTPRGLRKEIEKRFPPGVLPIAGRLVWPITLEQIGEMAAYGLTETWAAFPPFSEFKVLDENLREVTASGIGEICGRGVNCTIGYIKDVEKSEKLWAGGYLHTGDLVQVAENGAYFLADREKDLIISGGELIPTLRMESLLSTNPKIEQITIVAAVHEKWGERPICICVPKTKLEKGKEEELREELEELLKEHEDEIPKWHRPEKYIFRMEPLPLTSVGKIDKKVLRKQYQDVLVAS